MTERTGETQPVKTVRVKPKLEPGQAAWTMGPPKPFAAVVEKRSWYNWLKAGFIPACVFSGLFLIALGYWLGKPVAAPTPPASTTQIQEEVATQLKKQLEDDKRSREVNQLQQEMKTLHEENERLRQQPTPDPRHESRDTAPHIVPTRLCDTIPDEEEWARCERERFLANQR